MNLDYLKTAGAIVLAGTGAVLWAVFGAGEAGAALIAFAGGLFVKSPLQGQ